MSLTFNLVVACNNLTALRLFSVYLTNYKLHEKPNKANLKKLPVTSQWIEARARAALKEIVKEVKRPDFTFPAEGQSPLLACITLGMQTPRPKKMKDVFALLSTLTLEYDKKKMPKAEVINGA